MSIGTTFVMAADGKFYAEPVFRGVTAKGNRWFLCFDEDEDPEFVLETTHGEEKPNRLLPEFCRTERPLTIARKSDRVFGKQDGKWVYAPAISYWVTGFQRIPVPLEYDRRTEPSAKMTGMNGTYYDFERKKR